MSKPSDTLRLACIGDVHGFWDDADNTFFNRSDYHGVLFTGDLPRLAGGFAVARRLSGLRKPAWLIPGNHDGCTATHLLAELKGWRALSTLGVMRMPARVRRLERALGTVQMGGFKLFQLDADIGLITARPHAMGPDRFYFEGHLRRAHGVGNYHDSAARLRALVDAAPSRLLFLAHNGPSGLGDRASDMWGCDFSPRFGDFGDPDLRDAIDYAQARGKQVLATVAGHMHQRHKRGGGTRRKALQRDGVVYINAACVPRIRDRGRRRHHVALTFDGTRVRADEVWVDTDGQRMESRPLID